MSRLCLVFLVNEPSFCQDDFRDRDSVVSLWVSEIVQLDDLFLCFFCVVHLLSEFWIGKIPLQKKMNKK